MAKEVKAGKYAVLVDCTPTLATPAYTATDLLFAATKIAGAVRKPSGYGRIASIAVIDKDDQGAALDLYFFSEAVTAGTPNLTPTLSDADAAKNLGFVSVSTYKDVGGAKLAYVKEADFSPIIRGDAAGDIYVAGITAGTPTHSANGLVLRVGIVQA